MNKHMAGRLKAMEIFLFIVIAALVACVITMAGMINDERMQNAKLERELVKARAERTQEFYRNINVCKRER